MIVTRPEPGVLLAWIGAWVVVGAPSGWPRAGVAAAGTIAAVSVAVAWISLTLNHLRFGDWTMAGYPALTSLFRLSRPTVAEGALGLLLSPGRDVLLFFPLAWLAGPGLVRLFRDRHPAGSPWSALIGTARALSACHRGWWGGWNWGPRFLLPLRPIVSLAAAYWAARGARGRARLLAALAGLCVLAACTGMLVDCVRFGGLPVVLAAGLIVAALLVECVGAGRRIRHQLRESPSAAAGIAAASSLPEDRR